MKLHNWIIYQLPRKIKNIGFYIKRFYQRGKRGWADSDVWNFDYYLSKIISEGLGHLQKNQYILPTWREDLTEEKASKKWKYILTTIINTFKTAIEIEEQEIFYIPKRYRNEEQYKKMVDIIRTLKKKDPEMYRDTRVLNEYESVKFEEGFDLFKEYFFSFWD